MFLCENFFGENVFYIEILCVKSYLVTTLTNETIVATVTTVTTVTTVSTATTVTTIT